jgi:tetratricopeptide (TPR) repeat protein
MSRRSTLPRAVVLIALALLPVACDDGAAVAVSGPAARLERSADPRAVALRQALAEGRAGTARVLLDQVAARLGPEGPCLRARLAVLENDVLSALRELESAKSQWPADPRPYATGVEVYTLLGRLDAAQEEYQRGLTVVGRTPELVAAQGVLAIHTTGGAESGLAFLEEARRLDPELPFLTEPLARARSLMARQALRNGELDRAEALARAALELRPADVDARLTLSDVHKGRGDFEGAISWLEALVQEGAAARDDLATLHHAAATAGMVRGDLAGQRRHYLRARELGFDDQRLGHGALVLARAADEELERGLSREREVESAALSGEARRSALEAAEQHYREALLLSPASVETFHRLATTLFKLERFREAALAWESARAQVLAGRTAGRIPAVPLELNAAQAWQRAERPDLARERLLEFLQREPEGEFAGRARDLLATLPAEAAAEEAGERVEEPPR